MTHLETPRQRALLLIVLLGVAIAVALTPFAMGLLGAAVLYVICAPLHRRLSRYVPPVPAAVLVLALIALLALLPGAWLVGLVINQAPETIRTLQQSALLARLGTLQIGTINVGAELAAASGTLLSWVSQQAFTVFGSAARGLLNLMIALFGLYYLLFSNPAGWERFRAYLPFSPERADLLRARFFSVTQATLLGMLLTATLQGLVIGLGFQLAGLPHAAFWGAITGIVSVLPMLGSALVWLPGVAVLVADGRLAGALLLAAIGALVASNIDNVVRLVVYRRVANIHPMITLVGAFAGLKYFGLMGILLGPLAIFYFFELLRLYREEYGVDERARAAAEAPPGPALDAPVVIAPLGG